MAGAGTQGEGAAAPRIILIHALAQSVTPIHAAFRQGWPEAETHDLLDTALATDLAAAGGQLGQSIIDRFAWLTRYAQDAAPAGRPTRGILFTCSSFGPAIEAARAAAPIPVLKPNETAFRKAVKIGSAIVLLASFEPALEPMLAEMHEMRAELGRQVSITGQIVPGALAALQAGDAERHDALIGEAAAGYAEADTIVLGQFSMARAAGPARDRLQGKQLLTTPDSAVAGLRELVETAMAPAAD